MNPEFTIVTPVLNMAQFIGRCMESVRSQDVELEHIIIDGGSTDGTLKVIDDLKDNRTTIISEPDRGQSDAINKGLKLAKGDWFNWLNADDELTENALRNLSRSIERETLAIAGRCEHVRAGETIATGRTFKHPSPERTLADYQMGQPSHFYKTEVVRDLGGLNIYLDLAMDMDLWIRFVLKYGTDKVELSNDIVSKFHLHPSSKSVAQSDGTDQAKFGMFMALLNSVEAPKWILDEVAPMATDLRIDYDTSDLSGEKFISFFAFKLLLLAYERGDIQTANKLFQWVVKTERLSTSEKMEWSMRTKGASAQLIKTLRRK